MLPLSSAERAWIHCRLINWEGFVYHAYKDPAGVWTIGYGHTGGVKRGDTIDRADALDLLEDDWIKHRDAILSVTQRQPQTTEGQLIALTSLAFNIGVDAVINSTAMKYHLAGWFGDVPDKIRLWHYATVRGRKVTLPGLVRRREAEAQYYAENTPYTDEPKALIPI